jgi:hemerythrin
MLIDKQDMPIVAMEFMNEVHTEDIDIINELFELILQFEQNPSNEYKEILNKKYKEWYEHTVNHFKGEEVMMEEKNFPPYLIHKGEHDNALSIMDKVFTNWEKTNDIQVLKHYFIEELPQWLVQHIQSMDTITAMFFKTGLSPCSMH